MNLATCRTDPVMSAACAKLQKARWLSRFRHLGRSDLTDTLTLLIKQFASAKRSVQRLLSVCLYTGTAVRSAAMTTNAPLPQYDMMTGQLVTEMLPVSANAAAMMANHADVVHVQLLDRMVVIPTAIVNVSLQNVRS